MNGWIAFRQPLGVVGHFDLLRDLRLRQLRRVHHERLVFDERPFEGFLRAIDIDALAILPRGVEKRADDARGEIGVLEFDVRGLDGERASRIS